MLLKSRHNLGTLSHIYSRSIEQISDLFFVSNCLRAEALSLIIHQLQSSDTIISNAGEDLCHIVGPCLIMLQTSVSGHNASVP